MASKKYKLACWNVNGIRATLKKGFWEILENRLNSSIVCIQETKADNSIMEGGLLNNAKYKLFFHSCAERKGYSGVATLSQENVCASFTGFNDPMFDGEGRIVTTKHDHFTLLNVYFPNGGQGPHRVAYKLEFYDACLSYAQSLRASGENVIVCGDFNTAHREIDLHDPSSNHNTTGFMPIERDRLNTWLDSGFIDSFRHFEPDKIDAYTWWDLRTRSRERNRGWRIDYFLVARELLQNLRGAEILADVHGSDHCPITLDLEF